MSHSVTSAAASVPAHEREDEVLTPTRAGSLIVYFLLGLAFGVLLIKSEVVSWFRIQEMFRFQSFHMYGILGSAVGVAAISLAILRRIEARSLGGELIEVPSKEMGRGYRYWIGGGAFGFGWALTGACPGPILALIGYGATPFLVVFASALLGTWVYAHLRPSLPH
jgi:uncharacterized protein